MGTSELFVDIETYSPINLKTSGVYSYSASPDFDIMMSGFALDDEPVQMVTGDTESVVKTLEEHGLFDPDVIKVAHNAQFERVCFSRGRFPGDLSRFLPPEEFHDTMAVAAELGLPQSLDKLAKTLKVTEKDTAGTALINYFCSPYRGRRRTPQDDLSKWLAFTEYCVQDVETLREVHRALGGWPTERERELFHVDQRINDRGIAVDLDLVRAAALASEMNKAESVAELRDLTRVDNPNSRDQLLAWVREQGILAPDLTKETVSGLLADPRLDPTIRRVLRIRQSLALTSSSKFEAALRHETGGRLRGQFKFFGAHTGRWSGRGVQLQNLARSAFGDPDVQEAAINDLKMGFGASEEALKKLVRPSLVGPFAVSDYSAIEARVVAWLAGEEWVLEAFRAGRDIYVETATRMGGLTRFQGKVAVLALGYNGGPASLINMAGGEEHLLAGMTAEEAHENPEMMAERLKRLVKDWRNQNRRIVAYWRELEKAFINGHGAPGAGFIEVERVRNDRILRLPSGRGIHYRSVSTKQVSDEWGRPKTEITFADVRYGRASTYGGRLVENVTQAVARDVLGDALLRLDRAGVPVVGHVHDEVLAETLPGMGEELVSRIMTELPEWAPGLPVAAEGFETYRYQKG